MFWILSGSRRQRFSGVNGARTLDHGSHIEGFSEALKAVGWKPELTLIHVVMHEPQFAGPMKAKLDVPFIQTVVKAALDKPLRQFMSSQSTLMARRKRVQPPEL